MAWLEYTQLQHYLKHFPLDLRMRVPTELESLLSRSTRPDRLFSDIPKFCRESNPNPPPILCKWKWDFEMEWNKVLELSYKLLDSSYTQERNYRILSCRYSCPTTLHKIDPSVSDVCWHCLRTPGTMLHVWSTCPHIVIFLDNKLQLYCINRLVLHKL